MNDHEELTLAGVIEDPDSLIDDSYILLKEFLAGLSERDQQIIKYRWQGLNRSEIAQRMGLSQSYISRLLSGILERYKKQRSDSDG